MKLSMMIALGLALTAGVTLATQSVYDDLGVPQSYRDDTAFWTLTGHAGPTVDTVDLEVKGLDSTLPSGDAVVTSSGSWRSHRSEAVHAARRRRSHPPDATRRFHVRL